MTFTHKIEGFQNLRFPCGNLFFIHVFNINRGRHNFRKLLLYMREQLLHWEHAVVNQINYPALKVQGFICRRRG